MRLEKVTQSKIKSIFNEAIFNEDKGDAAARLDLLEGIRKACTSDNVICDLTGSETTRDIYLRPAKQKYLARLEFKLEDEDGVGKMAVSCKYPTGTGEQVVTFDKQEIGADDNDLSPEFIKELKKRITGDGTGHGSAIVHGITSDGRLSEGIGDFFRGIAGKVSQKLRSRRETKAIREQWEALVNKIFNSVNTAIGNLTAALVDNDKANNSFAIEINPYKENKPNKPFFAALTMDYNQRYNTFKTTGVFGPYGQAGANFEGKSLEDFLNNVGKIIGASFKFQSSGNYTAQDIKARTGSAASGAEAPAEKTTDTVGKEPENYRDTIKAKLADFAGDLNLGEAYSLVKPGVDYKKIFEKAVKAGRDDMAGEVIKLLILDETGIEGTEYSSNVLANILHSAKNLYSGTIDPNVNRIVEFVLNYLKANKAPFNKDMHPALTTFEDLGVNYVKKILDNAAQDNNILKAVYDPKFWNSVANTSDNANNLLKKYIKIVNLSEPLNLDASAKDALSSSYNIDGDTITKDQIIKDREDFRSLSDVTAILDTIPETKTTTTTSTATETASAETSGEDVDFKEVIEKAKTKDYKDLPKLFNKLKDEDREKIINTLSSTLDELGLLA